MLETSQLSYFIAITVVGLGLTILGFFIWEGIATANAYQKGVTLYQQRDYTGAETAFRKVLSRHPSNDQVHLLLAEVLMQQDKLEESISEFRELIRRAPKSVDAYLRLGTALIKQDKIEEAVTLLKQARDLFKAQGNIQKADQTDRLLQQLGVQ